MRIVIIEDENPAAEALESIILDYRENSTILATLPSVEEAVEWFQGHEQPDLIFSDIHLSDGSSFVIFREINIKCPVIFTTAFNQYAIEAFKVNSVDYLLKPLKSQEVERAIDKYENLQQSSFLKQMDNLRRLLDAGGEKKSEIKSRFMVKSGQSIKAIPAEEVAYFLAEEGVVLLVNFDGNRYVINYTLDQLQEQLDPTLFYRANRKLLVHINAVREVKPYFKGRLLLFTSPDLEEEQVISSGKAGGFKDWLDL